MNDCAGMNCPARILSGRRELGDHLPECFCRVWRPMTAASICSENHPHNHGCGARFSQLRE